MVIQTPLSYPGGKSKIVKIIDSISHQYIEYREPFLGGGSVFYYMKQKHPNQKYWINDLYFELYNFWNTLQNNNVELIDEIKKLHNDFNIKNAKELFYGMRLEKSEYNPIELSAYLFVQNKTSFSSLTESGGFSELNFQKKFNKHFNAYIERLLNSNNILKNVKITNLDYEHLLFEEGDGVFIFLDPPYYKVSDNRLYGDKGCLHKIFDHEKFANDMKNCKHRWLITYDDSDYIRELFDFANIIPFNFKYSMRKNKIIAGEEIFITNYVSSMENLFN